MRKLILLFVFTIASFPAIGLASIASVSEPSSGSIWTRGSQYTVTFRSQNGSCVVPQLWWSGQSSGQRVYLISGVCVPVGANQTYTLTTLPIPATVPDDVSLWLVDSDGSYKSIPIKIQAQALNAWWQDPPVGTPPVCPATNPACHTPINVSSFAQLKNGKLVIYNQAPNDHAFHAIGSGSHDVDTLPSGGLKNEYFAVNAFNVNTSAPYGKASGISGTGSTTGVFGIGDVVGVAGQTKTLSGVAGMFVPLTPSAAPNLDGKAIIALGRIGVGTTNPQGILDIAVPTSSVLSDDPMVQISGDQPNVRINLKNTHNGGVGFTGHSYAIRSLWTGDLDISDETVRAQRLILGKDGNLSIKVLAAPAGQTGNAYACIDQYGTLFRSLTACR